MATISPAVDLGVFILGSQFPGQSQAAALRRARDVTVAAEDAGLAHAWFAEHHFVPYGMCPSATTFASFLLGATRRITVGTAISSVSTQHPVALGEQTALLDHLSDGRFVLGVGRGGPWTELEVFATGLDRYDLAFAESLDLLLAWLTRDRVGADGDFFTFREVAVVPRPATLPHPPLLVAVTTEASLELAAARGLPLLLGMHIDDDEKRRLVDCWAQVASAHGHDPTDAGHVSAGIAHVADTRDEAIRTLRARMPPMFAHGLGPRVTVDGRAGPPRDHAVYTDHLCSAHPVGTVDDCAARLAQSAERTGIRRYALLVEAAGERTAALETTAALGRDVAPRLAADPTSGTGREGTT